MTTEKSKPRRPLKAKDVRWLIYLAILLGIAGWRFLPRPWKPSFVLQTKHYVIASTAEPSETEEVGKVVEMLYTAYSNRFGTLPGFKHEHPISIGGH